MRAKPEVGIQFGAGGASAVEALEAEDVRDVGSAIALARRCLQAGASAIWRFSRLAPGNQRSMVDVEFPPEQLRQRLNLSSLPFESELARELVRT